LKYERGRINKQILPLFIQKPICLTISFATMMGWKDWLYIPKSDKIAVIVLLIIISILSGIYSVVSLRPENPAMEISDHIPPDYKEWQQALYENTDKPEDERPTDKTYYPQPYFQPKMQSGETIELNSADTNQLKTIPGIGSMFARRIVKYKESLGGYAKMEQLNEVWGLDTYLFSTITPYLTLEPKHDSIYINSDSFHKLLDHPYLNYKQVLAITDIRERKGKIKSLKRLSLLDEFKKEDIEKLALYASFK